VAKAAVAAPPSPAPAPAVDWQEQRTLAARAVVAAMGPMGDDLAMRIERCKSADELSIAVRRAADLLEIAATREQSAEFRSRFVKR
jgi:hypothetical protein